MAERVPCGIRDDQVGELERNGIAVRHDDLQFGDAAALYFGRPRYGNVYVGRRSRKRSSAKSEIIGEKTERTHEKEDRGDQDPPERRARNSQSARGDRGRRERWFGMYEIVAHDLALLLQRAAVTRLQLLRKRARVHRLSQAIELLILFRILPWRHDLSILQNRQAERTPYVFCCCGASATFVGFSLSRICRLYSPAKKVMR